MLGFVRLSVWGVASYGLIDVSAQGFGSSLKGFGYSLSVSSFCGFSGEHLYIGFYLFSSSQF